MGALLQSPQNQVRRAVVSDKIRGNIMKKKEIESSHIYQELKRLVKEQELMALGTVQEIYDYLMER